MIFFQMCVIALCVIRRCQTMITLETIQHLQRAESKFMELVFRDGTCYTDPTIRCVSIPSVAVDYKEYCIVAPFTVTESLSHNILFTQNSLIASGQFPDSFMAFVLNNYCGPAVNKSLQDIVQDCVSKECYVQAFIRLMNVIESVGISMLWRFCKITAIIFEKSQTVEMTIYYDMVDRLIAHIHNKFTNYFISTEPLRQIKAAIGVVKIKERPMEGRKLFFIDVCKEYSQRYGNMIDLVITGQFNNLATLINGHRTTKELYYILALALHYFEKKSDVEPISGGETYVMDQLKGDEIK